MEIENIKRAIEKWGSYGKLKIPSVSNEWNAFANGLYLQPNGKLWVNVYVQTTETDTDTSVPFSEFVKGYKGRTEQGWSFSFTSQQCQQFMDNVAKQISKLESGLGDKRKTIERLRHWSIVNPVSNYFYDKLNLKYYNFCASSYAHARYLRYCKGEDALKEFINDNWQDLKDKTDEELQKIYKEVFANAAQP